MKTLSIQLCNRGEIVRGNQLRYRQKGFMRSRQAAHSKVLVCDSLRQIELKDCCGKPATDKFLVEVCDFLRLDIHINPQICGLNGNPSTLTRAIPRCTCCGRLQGEPHAEGCRFAIYTIRRNP